MSITVITVTSLAVLVTVNILLKWFSHRSKKKQASLSNPQFVKFRNKFYLVYFFALFGDWLQGPYIYKLYSHYGFAEEQIAVLYVIGFGSSIIFGTSTGALADRVGRKKMSVIFCILYSICCLTKLSANFWVLCLGRVLGGISTSLLFSTFESWYVSEHRERNDFPSEWISVTFSETTFWNGILAIIAGILANIVSEWLDLSPVAPFILAIPFLLTACVIIIKTWDENYGHIKQKYMKSCFQALRLIFTDEKILILGVIQSLFECVMYMFVFLWTPILEPLKPQFGLTFSSFMLALMIGSSIYQIMTGQEANPVSMLMTSVILMAMSMAFCIWSTSPSQPLPYVSYLAFLILEISVGMYFPSVGYLRSRIIPEKHRSSMMNWFRVPMNMFTCLGLMFLHSRDSNRGNQIIFALSFVVIVFSAFLVLRLKKLLKT